VSEEKAVQLLKPEIGQNAPINYPREAESADKKD